MIKSFNPLVIKLFVLSTLLIVSSLPRCAVDSVIAERQAYQSEAVSSVVHGWAERHSFGNITMSLPYSFPVEVETEAEKGKKQKKIEIVSEMVVVNPQTETITMGDQIEFRKRGIFEIPIYKADVVIEGSFRLPQDLAPKRSNEVWDEKEQSILFATPHSGSISDFALEIDGKKQIVRRSAAGLQTTFSEGGFKPGQTFTYKLTAKLVGYGGVDISGAADEFAVSVNSKWPHPSFRGQLPSDQNIRKDGFSANWKIMQSASSQQISIDYIEPINIYSQGARALKYGSLITLLCLSALFLMETLGKMSIHGMQYLFMTLPLTSFYILLIAFAEHIGFSTAYVIASAAVIGLIFMYFKGIGASYVKTFALSTVLAGLYALVYSMLSSEDYALLTGAISTFLCLAAIMLFTRKINWSKPMGN